MENTSKRVSSFRVEETDCKADRLVVAVFAEKQAQSPLLVLDCSTFSPFLLDFLDQVVCDIEGDELTHSVLLEAGDHVRTRSDESVRKITVQEWERQVSSLMFLVIKLLKNFLELNSLAPELLIVVVELAPGDVEVVGGDLHEGLGVDGHRHTQDEVFDFFAFPLDLVVVHTPARCQLEMVIFSDVLEVAGAQPAFGIDVLVLLLKQPEALLADVETQGLLLKLFSQGVSIVDELEVFFSERELELHTFI